jgi:hypothetical protein
MNASFLSAGLVFGREILRVLVAIVSLLLALTPIASAQTTYDWLNTAPDGNWKRGADGARWNPGGLWDEPPQFNILRLNNNHFSNTTNNVAAGYIINQLLFGSSSTTSRNVSGNALSFSDANFGATGPKIENQANATHTVSLNITGDTDNSLELNPVSGDLTISGTINNNGSFIDVFGNNSKWLRLEGIVSGSGGLAIKQNSTVVIKADMSYAGDTVVEAGFLNLGESTTAGSLDSRVKLASGTILTVVSDSSVAGVSENGVNNAGTVTINNGKTLTINGTDQGTLQQSAIGGDGGLTLSAAGNTVLRLYGNNQYKGATTITDGTLELAGVAGTGGLTQTASVSVSGGGVLLIANSNQVRDGASVSLSGGTIQRGNGVSETFGALTLEGDSFLDFGSGTTGNMTFGIYEGGTTPSNKLTVNRFAEGNTLVFGNNVGSFLPTGGALSNAYFSFNNGFTYNSSTFTITAIPEPSTYLAVAGLFALFLWPIRRRLLKDVKSVFGPRPTGRAAG